MKSNSNVLFIGAHPDDIELGCGATVSNLKRHNNHITWLVLSNCNESLPVNMKDSLIEELFDSAKFNGVSLVVKEFPVRRFSEHRNDIREFLYELNRLYKFNYVFTHNSNDIHQDHQVVADESIRVFRKCKGVFMYGMQYNLFRIVNDIYFEVKPKDVESKIESLRLYKSQVLLNRPYFSDSYTRSILFNNGINSGCEYAEGFELYKMVEHEG